MAQVVTQTIAISDTVNETLSLGTATAANIQATTAASFSYATGTSAAAIDLHYEHTYTLASSATTTLVLSALTDDLGRTVAFARLKRLMVNITSKTGNDTLTVGAAGSSPITTLLGGTTPTYIVRGLDIKVAQDATGFVVTASTADQLKFNNTGAASMTFTVSITGCSV